MPNRVTPVGTFRCTACGFLESYASLEFGVKSRRQFSLRELFYLITTVALLLGLLVAFLRR
jgi:hypothetical protein